MKRLAVMCILGSLALAGCGSGPSQEDQVRDTLTKFTQAIANRDYDTVCSDLLARELLTRLNSVGLPCSVALRRLLSGVQQPTLKVLKVRIRQGGKLALAEVRTGAANQRPSTDTFRLLHEHGRWKIGSLSGAQPPAPNRPVNPD